MDKFSTAILRGLGVLLVYLYSQTAAGQARHFHRWDYVFSGVSFASGAALSYPVTGNTGNLVVGWRTQIADSTGATVLFKAPVGGFGRGSNVLTATNQSMPNGMFVATYGDALLVPRPNHPENYYFVSVGYRGTVNLLYSIIDTRLNGGQGDFVLGGPQFDSLNQVLHPQAIVGLMLARHANRRDLWVLSATGTGFRCYRVTPAGIQRAGVASPFRGGTVSAGVSIKLTSRGTELLVARSVAGPGPGNPAADTEVYRFDPATGQVSQGRLVRRQRNASFAVNYLTPSPNGRYAYEQVDSVRGRSVSTQIVQYDLMAADSVAFRRSRRLVYWSDTITVSQRFSVFDPFRAGPDGRLYLLNANAGLVDSVSVIERPDAPAAQCRFRRSALLLTNSISGGNSIDILEHIPSGFNFLAGFRAVPACQGAPVRLALDNAAFLDSARWHFGDGGTTASLGPLQHLYAQPGTYRVRVRVHYGGYSTDTLSQLVTVRPAPTLRLPADTASCGGQTVVLAPRGLSAGITGYRWSTGATTPTLSVALPGTYSLTVTNAGGCTATAQVRFTAPPAPTLALPPDTVSCGGAALLLRPRAVSANVIGYRWSTGATTPALSVTQAGTYTLTVATAAGCTASAQVRVTLAPLPAVRLPADTVACAGAGVVLRPRGLTAGIVSYRWSTGATSPSLTATQPGTYTLTVTTAAGCAAAGTTQVRVVPAPTVRLPADSLICPQGAVRLLRPLAVSADVVAYRWQDGSSQPTFRATQPGTYTLTVATAAGCTATARTVLAPPLVPALLLGPDTTVCRAPVLLRVRPSPASGLVREVRWPDGSTGPTYAVAESGTYQATVTVASGCTYAAQVRVTVEECPSQFTVPNIITPNGDGRNDAFVVPGLAPGQWRLEIYSRWGRMVYERTGYVNGAWGGDGLAHGVYYYRLSRPGYQLKGWVEIVR